MKARSTPGSPAEVTVKPVWSPYWAASTDAAAALTPRWAAGYSWNAAVVSSGVQVG